MVTDLQPPDVEMGLAILHKKAQLMDIQLPDYILLFLADRVRTDIRRLGSALFHVELYALLLRKGLLPLSASEDFFREFLHEK